MKKYKLALIITIVFIVLLIVWGKLSQKPTMILFYGDSCPHCKIVEEYISANNVKDKYHFQELEVYNNKQNAQLLAQAAKQCGVDTEQGVGVPFFFDGQNCFIGDQDIINFFNK